MYGFAVIHSFVHTFDVWPRGRRCRRDCAIPVDVGNGPGDAVELVDDVVSDQQRVVLHPPDLFVGVFLGQTEVRASEVRWRTAGILGQGFFLFRGAVARRNLIAVVVLQRRVFRLCFRGVCWFFSRMCGRLF